MTKKPVLIFTCADINNFDYAVKMLNSLVKYHSPKDVDILLITNEQAQAKLDQLPKGVILEDLNIYTESDPYFFYRQKPIVSEKYLDEYELVLGMDCDQIVTGKLDYIFETKDYDVGTVINWNRVDPATYGFVEFPGILPIEYFNCGLVALRSKKFAHHWKVLCFSPQFERLPYREQDLLNILCYYGNYNVRCFDHGDGIVKMSSWWGLINKGEMNRMELKGDEIIVPKGFGDTPFPPQDMTIKVIHFAGGQGAQKFNYKTMVSEEVGNKLDELIK